MDRVWNATDSCFGIRQGTSRGHSDGLEFDLGHTSDIEENQVKTFQLGGRGSILLIKQDGIITAIGSHCTHQGVSLANGILGRGRIRCTKHGACFNIKTGDIEDFPGNDSLHTYEIIIGGDNKIKLRTKPENLYTHKRQKSMVHRNMQIQHVHVMVGGGIAALNCAECLRQQGYQGRIIIATKDSYLPYDRSKFSTKPELPISEIIYRTEEFFFEYDIEVMMNAEAVNIDVKNHTVTLKNNVELNYDALFIATGTRPRVLALEGADLKNVLSITAVADANYLYQQASQRKRVVILGSAFIAMEMATYCLQHFASVTVICNKSCPFEEELGKKLGYRIMELYEKKAVVFFTNKYVTGLKGDGGILTEVHLSGGIQLQADLLIVAIGVIPNTQFMQGSGIFMDSFDHTIVVNEFLCTNVKNVYAGGDIVRAPLRCMKGERIAIQHMQMAQYHGYAAAMNMLAIKYPVSSVPFYWSNILSHSLQFVGCPRHYDDITIYGNLESFKFAAHYSLKDDITFLVVANIERVAAIYAERVTSGKMLTKQEVLAAPKYAWWL